MKTRVAFVLAAFAAAVLSGVLFAADPESATVPTLTGTVTSISGVKVELTVDGEKPAWVKKGAGIKVAGGLGKIVAVAPTTVTFNARKAPTLTVGEKLTVEKGRTVPAGC